ncbi:MAG: hypothetical protein IKK52_06960 [Alphaproteobacteria bacterium]|nr:hypothetical protein [Alphaproteobacteria bacterium]
MADNDDINEARRKAMRNGEEDPVVVAQRYLNIYRQMHIFSPERKLEFDKMLLELPSSIYGILSSLPGGMVLQDYINDLNEKNGKGPLKTADSPQKSTPILEEAISQTAQPQVQPTVAQPVQVVSGGNMEISLGKDFAEQFAGAFDNLLKRQGEMQAENLEKISASLSKNQLALAQYINQNKEAQQQALAAIAKAFEQAPQTVAPQNVTAMSADNTLVLQQLIEGQKEINLRLNKMESTSLSGNSVDNQELISALVKSNTEAMQKFASMQTASPSAAVTSATTVDNTERLLQLIEQSQSQLIEGVVQRILQNNVSIGQSQANNNANNIQINTPDTSAQTILLVNKITDLQAANEKNMEEAINRLIAAQKEMYESIDHNRSQEIADAIVKGLQSSSLTINNYVPQNGYVPSEIPQTSYPINQQQNTDSYSYNDLEEVQPVAQSKKKKKKKKDRLPLYPSGVSDELAGINDELTETAGISTENDELNNLLDVDVPNNTDNTNYIEEEVANEPVNFDFEDEKIDTEELIQEDTPVDNSNYNEFESSFDTSEIISEPQPETKSEYEPLPDSAPAEVEETQNIEAESISEAEDKIFSSYNDEKNVDSFIQEAEALSSDEYDNDIQSEYKMDLSSSDIKGWGFDADAQEESFSDDSLVNFSAETTAKTDPEEQYEEVEMIGDDSYIYMDDLSKPQSVNDNSPIIYDVSRPKLKVIPQIYDDSDDDDSDPYANSVRKD